MFCAFERSEAICIGVQREKVDKANDAFAGVNADTNLTRALFCCALPHDLPWSVLFCCVRGRDLLCSFHA